jgi:hypothetical protein
MFNFLKNLFKPKNTEGPHPLDGPVRAATEKAALPEPLVTPMFIPPAEPKPVEVAPVPEPAPAPTPVPEKNFVVTPTEWPFPVSKPAPAPEVKQEKKPRKPRAPKAVVMSTQPKKKK